MTGYCHGYTGKCKKVLNVNKDIKSLGDLQDSTALPTHRYRRVKYEDLVSDPEGTMRDLYNFAGIPVTKEMLISVKQHFNAELLNKSG